MKKGNKTSFKKWKKKWKRRFPKMKEVFRLRVIEVYKFKEIAEELGITENNAKVQMNGAIRMIREKLPDLKKRLFFLIIW